MRNYKVPANFILPPKIKYTNMFDLLTKHKSSLKVVKNNNRNLQPRHYFNNIHYSSVPFFLS